MDEEKNINEETTNEQQLDNPNMKFENEPKTEEERKLFELNKKIEELQVENDDKEDRIKRLVAEFENSKKRSDKEREFRFESVMMDVITKILPAIDNLEKAANAETQDTEYKKGVEMVLAQFKDTLKACNVTEIEAVGKPFDPTYHEAVMNVEDPNLGTKVVKEEYRKGYMLGDKVIRYSLVIVAN